MDTVLISMCSLGVPCQYRARSFCRGGVIQRLLARYHLVPVCPEQLGGLPTPRPACYLEGGRVVSRLGEDYTAEYVRGAEHVLRIAQLMTIRRAYLKKGSPSCGKDGITRRLLELHGIRCCTI